MLRWWFLAEEMCRQLTRPPGDAADDRQVEQLIRDSRLWASSQQVARNLAVAWQDSGVRRVSGELSSQWRASDPRQMRRRVGWMLIVAAATTLVVQALAPGGLEPLAWMLPASAATGGLLLMRGGSTS
jgi:hypothetical protein